VFFFIIESKDRSLKEIDMIYALGADARKRTRWEAKEVNKSEMQGF
jgi:hypothetical protein